MKILTPNSNKHAVHVYSEIGNLKEVIVQKPGDELRNFDVGDRQSFLMDGDIDVVQARKEHDRFVNILKKNGVKVYYFNDLFCETWDLISDDDKIRFINKFVNETKQPSKELCEKIKNYLIVNFLKNAKGITKVLIEGIQSKDLYETTSNRVYITKPLANIYFQRDNYSCFGDCVSINKMKYLIRQRESLLSELV
jgi:arginine deiminase